MLVACHPKRSGITPTIVRGVSLTVMTCPSTSSRPPNFSIHVVYSSTTTGAAPGWVSASVKTRPFSGGTARYGNEFAVISVTVTMSEPAAVRMVPASVALTTTVSNGVCCSTKSMTSSCPIAPLC